MYKDYLSFKPSRDTVTGLSIFVIAYSLSLNLFQTYVSLKVKTNANAIQSVNISILLANLIYIPVAICGVFLFGSSIHKDLFLNIGQMEMTAVAYLLKISFIMVIATHIPFIFFAGKEAFLVIVDELHRCSIS